MILGSAGAATLVLAWGLVSRGADASHAAWHPRVHDPGPGTLVLAVAMWQVMMVAMMLPVVWPWLKMVAVTHAAGRVRGPLGPVAGFASGYFASWSIYAVAAAGTQLWAQSRLLLTSDLALAAPTGGFVLVVAGAFQFTRLKQACLRHCRSPFVYLLSHWDNGPRGVFRLGLTHGFYCVACCWALMAVGFALGLMNLAWMGAMTVAAALEQTAPGGPLVSRLVGVALVAWGVSLMV